MNKNMLDRLKGLESAQADGSGGLLFVTERAGFYVDDHSGRRYTEAQLVDLHRSRADLVIIAAAETATSIPSYPAHAPEGMTLFDLELMNARTRGRTLGPEQNERLDAFERARQEQADAYEEFKAIEEPHFEETVRRMARLDARHTVKRQAGLRR